MDINTKSSNLDTLAILTLANAGEIISSVIKEIAGNDISNSINGSKITTSIIQSLAYQNITKQLLENKNA